MKRQCLFAAILLMYLLTGCSKYNDDEIAYYDDQYVPILMKAEDIQNSVVQMPAREIKSPGKIYCLGNYLFIIEKYIGFHIINNSDPSNPVNLTFMSVPGCVDIAVKDDFAYVDNATDLVTINISDKSNMYFVNRVPNMFPELLPPDKEYIPYWFNKENRPQNTIIVGWKLRNEAV